MIEPHKVLLPINQGGLMRCCIQSLLEAFTIEDEGDIYTCPYCHSQMIVINQQWQWNPED